MRHLVAVLAFLAAVAAYLVGALFIAGAVASIVNENVGGLGSTIMAVVGVVFIGAAAELHKWANRAD